jgi:hypothetical protein
MKMYNQKLNLMNKIILPFFLLLYLGIDCIGQNNGYWQQHVEYDISVRLDDTSHFLHAHEEVKYTNNSPDILEYLYFHLWPNAYKNNGTAYAKQQLEMGSTKFYFADNSERGYIDSLDFKSNGENLKWEYHRDHIDIAKIFLNKPLYPGETITITTPFRVKIPNSFSRLGHVKQQYQITQWYPKPAVYDQKGWHPMPYLDIGEFYSEFGTFKVSITLPDNYIVGATGVLQDEKEKAFLDTLASENISATILRTAEKKLRSAEDYKTITYVQDNIHDFAWFAGKKYAIIKDSVILPGSGRVVDLYAMYDAEDYDVWRNIGEYMHDAVYYYSKWIGDYPYDVLTVVDGGLGAGAGMEYPMITVLRARSEFFLEMVTMHEIGHNWFYGVLGTNERVHPWMDEGINSYFERRYLTTKYPDMKLSVQLGNTPPDEGIVGFIADQFQFYDMPYERYYELAYKLKARINHDQPVDLHSTAYTMINYGTMVYYKSALIFNQLEKYLGKEKFDEIMQEYYAAWQFKHPYPDDFKKIVKKKTGKDMEWFFNDLLSSDDILDYKVRGLKKTRTGYKVALKNLGKVDSPLPLSAVKDGEIYQTKYFNGFRKDTTIDFETKEADKFVLDANHNTIDLYRKNNHIETRGLFKKAGPLQVKFLGTIEEEHRTQLMYLPVIGANTNDKFMAGIAVYNNVFPPSRFHYMVMPMYSTGLEKLAGSANFIYSYYPTKVFQEVKLGVKMRGFAGFEKISPGIEFTIMPQSYKSSPVQKINFGYHYISVNKSALPLYPPEYKIINGAYTLENKKWLVDYRFKSEINSNIDNFLSWENSFDFSYKYAPKAYIDGRLYHGQFLMNDNVPGAFQFGLSGSTDYLMNSIFLDRAMTSRNYKAMVEQTDLEQGGFRGYVPVFSDQSITSLSLSSYIPGLPVFSVFADGAVVDNFDKFYWDMGLRFALIRDIFEIYLPVVGDPFSESIPDGFADVFDKTRFVLKLNALNPFELIRNVR